MSLVNWCLAALDHVNYSRNLHCSQTAHLTRVCDFTCHFCPFTLGSGLQFTVHVVSQAGVCEECGYWGGPVKRPALVPWHSFQQSPKAHPLPPPMSAVSPQITDATSMPPHITCATSIAHSVCHLFAHLVALWPLSQKGVGLRHEHSNLILTHQCSTVGIHSSLRQMR